MKEHGHKGYLSSKEDWQGYYQNRSHVDSNGLIDTSDFRNYQHKILVDRISRFFNGGSVIEIGAGGSDFLVDFGMRFRPRRLVGLDYLEYGCRLLDEKAQMAGVDLEVVCADLFNPPNNLLNSFDFVINCGVVEHFEDLPGTLQAIGRFAKKNGVLFTTIPNLYKTIYGTLMRFWNKKIYDLHVPYSINDMRDAHYKAGLEVVSSEYLMSSNFGVLSWGFEGRRIGFPYWIYKQLTRLSKVAWLIEMKTGIPLPTSRYFSPIILCVGRRSQ